MDLLANLFTKNTAFSNTWAQLQAILINMNTLRIVSGYVTNFHKPGNKVILLHVPESYINATTMSKWLAALKLINYKHITKIHHHRNIGSKLPQTS